MILCRTAVQLETALARQPRERTLVPTMGALHDGHLSLFRIARESPGAVVATVFVNRHQFDDPEDFACYPREEEEDFERLRQAGVDLTYAPDEQAVWGGEPPRLEAFERPGLTDVLEGRYRPGHPRAVAAVVSRLFDQTVPTAAVFGEKDYQQLVLVRRLAAERQPPIRIVAAPVVREPDGLAMSSRNRRLDPRAREQAAGLHRTLEAAAESIKDGLDVEQAQRQAFETLIELGFEPDYVEVREADSLCQPAPTDRDLVILAAARLSGVRLLDVVRFGLALS
ncbi:MAG: pantoate--beta-alanine ligase [Gammaproteobacteria bacterium]|nr:pantoate--beta-alanine ligase [Gammaproteobacteria bacterium]